LTPADIVLGPDLKLHPVSVEDAEELYAAIDRNRERLRQWLPWIHDGYDLSDTLRFLEHSVAENNDGSALTGIIRRNGSLCGTIGLHRIDKQRRASSIGYWLEAGCEGRGIMTRACRAVVEEGFRTFGLHRIEIRCDIENKRSSAIPLRLGFVEEGILRGAEWLYDHWVDLRVFSMLESDW
jgi:ribosomal-protein-serine acetyltransferase